MRLHRLGRLPQPLRLRNPPRLLLRGVTPMKNDPLADELETLEVLGDPDVLTAEQGIWDAAGLKGANPEFLDALRDYRRAVLVACARYHDVRPTGPTPW